MVWVRSALSKWFRGSAISGCDRGIPERSPSVAVGVWWMTAYTVMTKIEDILLAAARKTSDIYHQDWYKVHYG